MLRKSLISVLLVLTAFAAQAQKRVSVEAETKTLSDGKVTTVTKRILCDRSGRLVTVYFTPNRYIVTTTLKGEVKFYLPATNEVISMVEQGLSSNNELLYLFLSGRTSDLGLVGMGYTLKASEMDAEGYMKRTYVTSKQDSAPTVELVLKDYLPVYVEYQNHSGTVLGRTYLSGYDLNSSFVFPQRVTEITYNLEKRDSVLNRTIYSAPDISGKDSYFDYQVPADAKPVANPLDKLKNLK